MGVFSKLRLNFYKLLFKVSSEFLQNSSQFPLIFPYNFLQNFWKSFIIFQTNFPHISRIFFQNIYENLQKFSLNCFTVFSSYASGQKSERTDDVKNIWVALSTWNLWHYLACTLRNKRIEGFECKYIWRDRNVSSAAGMIECAARIISVM